MSAIPPPPPARPDTGFRGADPSTGWGDRSATGDVSEDALERAGESEETRGPRLIGILVGVVAVLAFSLALILVIKFGPKLRPTLATWLGRTSQQALAREIERLKKDGPREHRVAAAKTLIDMGEEAVIEALDATNSVSLPDNSVEFSVPVWQAFAEVGPSVLPALLRAARSDKDNVRAAAVGVLREMGPAAEPAVATLTPLVQDKNRWVAGFACDALGNVGPKAAGAVAALAQVVQQPESPVRRRAIVTLGRIGPAAKAAVPALEQARQRDDDKDVREAAAVALNEIDLTRMIGEATRQADSEVRELIRRLREAEKLEATVAAKLEATVAARTLGKRGAGAKAAIPALAAALASRDKWLREAAAEALGLIGPDSKTVLPALQRATEDKEPEVQDAAKKALERIGA